MFGMDLRPQGTLKALILDQVRRLNATYMEASYDGGNDEGGVSGVTLYREASESSPAFVVKQTAEGSNLTGYFSSEEEAKNADLSRFSYMQDLQPVVVRVTEGRVPMADPPGLDWEHTLWRAVDDLLSHDFGTWAGDFSASGIVYADPASGRVWREGSMSTYIDDPEAGEY